MTGIVNGIIGAWARNRVAANLLMLLAFAGGIVGIAKLEKETLPGGFGDSILVEVDWPGWPPEAVESQVLVELEEALGDLEGLRRVTSEAYHGFGWLRLQIRSDADSFLALVNERLAAMDELPPGVFRPVVKKEQPRPLYFGVALHGDIDLKELRRTARVLRDEMAQLPGGGLARLSGVLREEVTVELSERAMRGYGVDFLSVAESIRSFSVDASAGSVRTDTGSVGLRARAAAESAEQFESIIVRQSPAGGIVRLGDVAVVKDGFEDLRLEARYQGRPAAFISFPSPRTMDIMTFARSLERYVEERNRTLPEGLELTTMWSDNDFFGELTRIIFSSAFFGILLVCLLLVLFLRPVVAFWVSVGIATAFAGGLALAPYLGVSLNILSLFGCLLVIGIIVDDAIIIGENIHTQVERRRRGGIATVTAGAGGVARPVIFGLLTTMVAFAPWALLSGPEQQFTKHLTLTVVAALTFSLVESFCILPNHLSHMRPQRFAGHGARLGAIQAKIAGSLLWFADNVYRRAIEFALKFRYATVAAFISLVIVAVGLVAHSHVRSAYLPEIEGNVINVRIALPGGTPFQRIQEVRDRLERSIDRLMWENQNRYRALEQPIIKGRSVIAREPLIEAWIILTSPDQRPSDVSSKDLSNRLREIMGPVKDADEVRFDFSFDQRTPRITFSLSHPELGPLKAAVEDLKLRLSRYPSAFGVGDTMSSPMDEARFTLKPGAEAIGLTLSDVLRQMSGGYNGQFAQRLVRDGHEAVVMVRLPDRDRQSLDSLRDLRIRTADGRRIPLPEVVDVEFVPGLIRVQRRDRRRAATVFANVPDKKISLLAEEIASAYLPILQQRYPGLVTEEIGDRQLQREFTREVLLLQGVAFLLMYLLLATAFCSYGQPFLIMTAIPFGFAGAVFAHFLVGLPVAMFSIFGIAAAAGVVVNDNLVLIDQINFLRRKQRFGTFEALIEAGVSRFRPVFLTSLTTVIGLMPIMLDRSVQGGFLKPMVVSMAGAVIFALFVTLLMVPALYAIAAEIRRGLGRLLAWRPRRPLEDEDLGWDAGRAPADPEDMTIGEPAVR